MKFLLLIIALLGLTSAARVDAYAIVSANGKRIGKPDNTTALAELKHAKSLGGSYRYWQKVWTKYDRSQYQVQTNSGYRYLYKVRRVLDNGGGRKTICDVSYKNPVTKAFCRYTFVTSNIQCGKLGNCDKAS